MNKLTITNRPTSFADLKVGEAYYRFSDGGSPVLRVKISDTHYLFFDPSHYGYGSTLTLTTPEKDNAPVMPLRIVEVIAEPKTP